MSPAPTKIPPLREALTTQTMNAAFVGARNSSFVLLDVAMLAISWRRSCSNQMSASPS
jgi:hypothetical protein